MLSCNIAWFYVWHSYFLEVVKLLYSRLAIMYSYISTKFIPILTIANHCLGTLSTFITKYYNKIIKD